MVSEIFTGGGAFTEGDPTVLHHWERAGSWSEGFWSWTGISRWTWWRPFIRRTVPRSTVLHLGCEVFDSNGNAIVVSNVSDMSNVICMLFALYPIGFASWPVSQCRCRTLHLRVDNKLGEALALVLPP